MMVTVRVRRIAAAALLLGSLGSIGGCSREQQDWRAAESRDTPQAYGQFIEHHPDSELVRQARTRMAQLGEDRDWAQAVKIDTAAAYQQFLAEHPDGKWAQDARVRAQSFSLDAAPASVSAAPVGVAAVPAGVTAAPAGVAAAPAGVAAVPAGVAAVPAGVTAVPAGVTAGAATPSAGAATPASRATPPGPSSAATPGAAGLPSSPASPVMSPAPTKGYGIQLGAFTSEERANTEWYLLEGRYAAQLHGLAPQIVAADTASGRVFRLQAEGGDEARARLICEELRQRSQQCVPVVPH